MSYNSIVKSLASGNVTLSELEAQYNKMRSTVSRQLRRIAKSDVAWIDENSRPVFATIRQLKTQENYKSALLHELADITKFKESKGYKLEDRRETRDKIINTMQQRGFKVDVSNYRQYIAFMRWFNSNINQLGDDSGSQRVREFFNTNVDLAQQGYNWQELFEEWVDEGEWGL